MRVAVLTLTAALFLILLVLIGGSRSPRGPGPQPFVYPNGQLVYVTRDTTVRNQHTWPDDGVAYESSSIEYVYRKLAEAVVARGSARLLDVGAQSGLYALYATHFDGIDVDAYEPFPESHACLVDNIALNGAGGKVRAFAVALSDTDSTRTMRYTPEHTGLNTLGARPLRFSGGSEVQVETRTIDGIYAATRVDVIKNRHGGVGVLRSARRPLGAPPRPARAAARGQRREHDAVRRCARDALRAPRRARVPPRRDDRRREHGVLRAVKRKT